MAPKQTIEVERLGIPEGDVVELDKVLFIGEDKETLVGNPTIKGAKVVAISLGEAKGEKVVVFKYKPKIRYRSKRGHRQTYTKILITKLLSQARGLVRVRRMFRLKENRHGTQKGWWQHKVWTG